MLEFYDVPSSHSGQLARVSLSSILRLPRREILPPVSYEYCLNQPAAACADGLMLEY